MKCHNELCREKGSVYIIDEDGDIHGPAYCPTCMLQVCKSIEIPIRKEGEDYVEQISE